MNTINHKKYLIMKIIDRINSSPNFLVARSYILLGAILIA